MAAKRRVNSNRHTAYTLTVDGTSARQAVAVPDAGRSSGTAAVRSVRAAARARQVDGTRVSERTMRNRSRALAFSRGYVVFLAVMAVMTVAMCVYYLQMKETVTSQLESNARLESRLTAVTSENDALYETITNSVDWDHVKDVAINKLGMTYATEDQVIWYNIGESGYVRQFRDVPTGD